MKRVIILTGVVLCMTFVGSQNVYGKKRSKMVLDGDAGLVLGRRYSTEEIRDALERKNGNIIVFGECPEENVSLVKYSAVRNIETPQLEFVEYMWDDLYVTLSADSLIMAMFYSIESKSYDELITKYNNYRYMLERKFGKSLDVSEGDVKGCVWRGEKAILVMRMDGYVREEKWVHCLRLGLMEKDEQKRIEEMYPETAL